MVVDDDSDDDHYHDERYDDVGDIHGFKVLDMKIPLGEVFVKRLT
jgi:hypothetical protein